MARKSPRKRVGQYGFNRTIAQPCESAASTLVRSNDVVTSTIGTVGAIVVFEPMAQFRTVRARQPEVGHHDGRP